MKKLLSLLVCLSIMLSCVVAGIGATASALEASPESDFIAFDGLIEEYVGPGGDVVIPAEIDGVPTVEIAQDAFVNNTDITAVYIPEGVEKIGHRAFRGCSNVAVIELPYSLYNLGTDVFYGTGITEITIPAKLEQIPYSTFSNCQGLSEIKFSYGVREIHSNAFFKSKPSRVVFPETLNLIAAAAFNYVETNARIEFVICNENITLGVQVADGGLYNEMMKGQWTDKIFRPWNSSTARDQVFHITVPEGSKTAEFVNNWRTNGLLEEGEVGACENSYRVTEQDEKFFDELKENQEDFGIQSKREDLTLEISGGSNDDGGDDSGTNDDDKDTNDKNTSGSNKNNNKNNSNKNDGNTTTTIVEEGNDSMMWIILAVVGGVFLLIIIGVVVFAVIFLKKPSKAAAPVAAAPVAEATVEETPAEETPAEETPADDAE